MADVTLRFRLGGTRIEDPQLVAEQAIALLRAKAEEKGVNQLVDAVIADQDRIVAAVAADASRFAAQAARVFTRIKSPSSGFISVSLDDVSRSVLITGPTPISRLVRGKTTADWIALSHRTVAKKKKQKRGSPTTFFVESGELRSVLITYLGSAMATLVDPRIVVRRGVKKVTVTLSLLATQSGRGKAGVTGDSFPGVAGSGAVSRDESLFVRYLKRVGAPDRDPRHPLKYKLENPRGSHRPFLQNMLAFWISSRLPIILDKSLRGALAKRRKKAA